MNRVAIHSVPRSGSSWLGQLFNSSPDVIYKYQPLFSYAFKGALHPQSSAEDIEEFFDHLAVRNDEFLDQAKAIESEIYPSFRKTLARTTLVYKEVRYHHVLGNLLEKDTSIRVVGLIRNPLAVLASWRQAPKEFKPEWKFDDEWRCAQSKNCGRPEEFFGFEKWIEATRIFLELQERYPSRFQILRYEQLINDPFAEVRRLFDWCQLAWQQQTEEFIEASRTQERPGTYSVFRSAVDTESWKRILPAHVVENVVDELVSLNWLTFVGDLNSASNK